MIRLWQPFPDDHFQGAKFDITWLIYYINGLIVIITTVIFSP
jgi:hypothetical protein